MAPAFTLTLKKSAGKSLRLLKGLAAAPSQLISRRPPACSPAVVPFDAPRLVRNSSTLAWMFPEAVITVATGGGGGGGGSVGPSSSSLHPNKTPTRAAEMSPILRIAHTPSFEVI